ncbi:hypothetical protein [Marinobacter sp. LQ44]|uniref:hypothetical protein n=1 Tax=unclassified Marinobacter TaxID=83889 RepID=UPI000718DAB5|nr:hypothetical protein [Marinobacter sp. LQ44]AMQ89202.1 hypothetical protein ASQ50_11125 [Marinobacter sp. LQ44]
MLQALGREKKVSRAPHSDGAVKVWAFLMIPQFAIPFYLVLIWLTPAEYRPYWAGVWFGGTVLLHLLNPVGGTGYQGGDLEPDSDWQFLLLVLRDSLMLMLPIAGIIFAVGLKIFG